MRRINKIIMNNLKFLLVYCLIHYLTGCNWYSNCPKLDLTEEELSWFNAYELGDIIVLESNKNKRDTLIVVGKTYGYSPCNKFELGPFQHGEFSIKLVPRYDSMDSDFLSIYYHFEKWDSIVTKKAFVVYDLHLSNDYGKRKLKEKRIFLQQKKDSIDTYLTDSTNSYLNNNQYVISFNWSKEYGLVKYETSQGEIFELISHEKGDTLSDFIKKYKKDSAPQEIR